MNHIQILVLKTSHESTTFNVRDFKTMTKAMGNQQQDDTLKLRSVVLLRLLYTPGSIDCFHLRRASLLPATNHSLSFRPPDDLEATHIELKVLDGNLFVGMAYALLDLCPSAKKA